MEPNPNPIRMDCLKSLRMVVDGRGLMLNQAVRLDRVTFRQGHAWAAVVDGEYGDERFLIGERGQVCPNSLDDMLAEPDLTPSWQLAYTGGGVDVSPTLNTVMPAEIPGGTATATRAEYRDLK